MQLRLIPLVLAVATAAMRLPNVQTKGLAKRQIDHCDDALSKEAMYDCPKPEGHILNPDGTCGNGKYDPDVYCNIYCEVRRYTFLGPEQRGPGNFGEAQLKSSILGLEEGEEITYSAGISIGVDPSLNDAFSMGASFQYHPGSLGGYWGPGSMIALCDDSRITTVGNVCSTAPVLNSEGNPRTVWAVKYVDKLGNAAPLKQQSPSYQDAVSSLGDF
ncbi:hypothetical protein NPX13_g4536 [Xylaria arbuscula]|uniref:Kazal-like domain-containing protein n=1 Tax=Xylaria arbuscula TaxID=114810 RepID=A0A9W8NGB5_9PEZI|nr:hypothetical protein NPX13_g4536 [Xylaria arbuscula]